MVAEFAADLTSMRTLVDLFSVSRATVYRTIHRDPPPPHDRHLAFAKATQPAS